jgi:hypothetical protein
VGDNTFRGMIWKLKTSVEDTSVVTPEEEIAELNDTKRGYERRLNEALAEGNNEHTVLFAGLINKAIEQLIPLQQERREERQLLAQQQQTNRGNFILF